MKVKKETTLFRILTGSHLYGTATEKSDFDYKAVCLPPLDELLLNTRVTNRKEKPEGFGSQDRMEAGGTETEYLPLQIFFNDFFDGQTYALEVAFAARAKLVEFADHLDRADIVFIQLMMDDLIVLYLTKNVQKMVGYAVSQSKLYGLKTQRYESISAALRTINEHGRQITTNLSEDRRLVLTLNDCPLLLDALLKLEHVKSVEILNAAGGKELAPGIEICGKQYPLTNRVTTLVKSLEKTVSGYGNRVKEFEGEGVDWKALSHAIRITEQVLELCNTGKLTFPRPNAKFLLDVKSGKLSLDEATDYLNNAFSKVDDAIFNSKLQERTPELETAFRAWKIQMLRDFYGIE